MDTDEALSVMVTCQGSCNSSEQVQWCPAWGEWLCPECRWQRNEAELRPHPGIRTGILPAEQGVLLLWPMSRSTGTPAPWMIS